MNTIILDDQNISNVLILNIKTFMILKQVYLYWKLYRNFENLLLTNPKSSQNLNEKNFKEFFIEYKR